MMRTLASALADVDARARQTEVPPNARPLSAMVSDLKAGALGPFLAREVVRVMLERAIVSAHALDTARNNGSSFQMICEVQFGDALYQVAMAADAAKPDEDVMSAQPDYDRTQVPNPIKRPA